MTMTTTEVQPKPTTGNRTPNARVRHYVALDPQGRPTDKALCGFEWDQLHVPNNGTICQACVDEMRKRERE